MTDPIMLLRSGTFTSNFVDQQILISFPSFHGVLASLFVWGAWRNAWKWFFVLVNGVMLLVTPVQGSHYAIDIAAGLVIGLVSIRSAHAFVSLGLQIASTQWVCSGSIARTGETV